VTNPSPPDAAGQALARKHERRLYLASHPLVYALSTWAAWRGPIVSVPRVGHLVSDLALAREVLSSPSRFAKTGPGALSDTLSAVIGRSALVNMDGAGHRELRGRLQGLFTPSYVADLVRQVFAAPLGNLVSRLRGGEAVDLARTAQLLIGRIACAILGLPLPAGREDETCLDLFRAGSEFATLLTLSSHRLAGRRLELARQCYAALTQAARAAYEAGDERCVPGRLRALGLDFEECRGVIGLLLLAGTETTASVLPRIVALLVDTGQWTTLRQRRDLLGAALDEGLRLTAAVPLMTRNVVAPTRLGGRDLGPDERVIVLLFKALQSEAMTAEPLHFDLGRSRVAAQAPLWFGVGPHFCLGAALARHELEQALTALLDVGDLVITDRRHGSRGLLPAYGRLEVSAAAASRKPPDLMKS
jgi:cytochrome P450